MGKQLVIWMENGTEWNKATFDLDVLLEEKQAETEDNKGWTIKARIDEE